LRLHITMTLHILVGYGHIRLRYITVGSRRAQSKCTDGDCCDSAHTTVILLYCCDTAHTSVILQTLL